MEILKKEKFGREIGLFGLTMTGVGSIIGSGWLFGAYLLAQMAGPGAIFAWIIGGISVMLIALTMSELSALIPKAGGPARYFEYTHGSLVGFIIAWGTWLGIVAVIPSEAEASVQYLASIQWDWVQQLNFFSVENHHLTTNGKIASGILLILYLLINYWSIKVFSRFVSAITVFKVLIPLLTGLMLLYSGFHPDNFTAINHTLIPYGMPSILTSIISCGIIFSFNGFQSPATLAAEAKNPGRDLPLSMILALLLALGIYLLLQIAFIGGVPPEMIKGPQGGWHGIQFTSPLVALALLYNLNFLALLLYVDSTVSPSGTGIIYFAVSSRLLYGMQRNGYMPKYLGKVNEQYKVPRAALVSILIFCFGILYLFPSWAHIIPIISVANIVSFLSGPLVLAALRQLAPQVQRQFKIPFYHVIALPCFIIITFLLYWAMWPLTGQAFGLLFLGLVIYAYYQAKQGWPNFIGQLKSAVWLFVYFFCLALISYKGEKVFGGDGSFSNTFSHILLVVLAIGTYFWCLKSAWHTPLVEQLIKNSKNEK